MKFVLSTFMLLMKSRFKGKFDEELNKRGENNNPRHSRVVVLFEPVYQVEIPLSRTNQDSLIHQFPIMAGIDRKAFNTSPGVISPFHIFSSNNMPDDHEPGRDHLP